MVLERLILMPDTKWYKIQSELRALNYKIKKFNIDNDLSVLRLGSLTVGKRYPSTSMF